MQDRGLNCAAGKNVIHFVRIGCAVLGARGKKKSEALVALSLSLSGLARRRDRVHLLRLFILPPPPTPGQSAAGDPTGVSGLLVNVLEIGSSPRTRTWNLAVNSLVLAVNRQVILLSA